MKGKASNIVPRWVESPNRWSPHPTPTPFTRTGTHTGTHTHTVTHTQNTHTWAGPNRRFTPHHNPHLLTQRKTKTERETDRDWPRETWGSRASFSSPLTDSTWFVFSPCCRPTGVARLTLLAPAFTADHCDLPVSVEDKVAGASRTKNSPAPIPGYKVPHAVLLTCLYRSQLT